MNVHTTEGQHRCTCCISGFKFALRQGCRLSRERRLCWMGMNYSPFVPFVRSDWVFSPLSAWRSWSLPLFPPALAYFLTRGLLRHSACVFLCLSLSHVARYTLQISISSHLVNTAYFKSTASLRHLMYCWATDLTNNSSSVVLMNCAHKHGAGFPVFVPHTCLIKPGRLGPVRALTFSCVRKSRLRFRGTAAFLKKVSVKGHEATQTFHDLPTKQVLCA